VIEVSLKRTAGLHRKRVQNASRETPRVVNLVADTHALVWYLSGRERRLSVRARRAFTQAEAGRLTIHVPAACSWSSCCSSKQVGSASRTANLREQLALRPGFPLQATDAGGCGRGT